MPTFRPPTPAPAPVLALAAMALGLGALLPEAATGQDVELLGRIHGTRPPDEYFQLRQRPGAFEFQRAMGRRLDRVLELRQETGFDLLGARPLDAFGRGAPASVVLGPRVGVVQGRFVFPVVLGLYADSPATPPFEAEEVQREFFDGPSSRYRTIPEFYSEISGGRVELGGNTFPWVRTTLTRAEVAGGNAGLGSSSQVGQYIVQILRVLDDAGTDWGQFDNDGPDGIPNSGDDDGFVDILVVMHPTRGGECAGEGRNSNSVWSHRWNLESRLGPGNFFTTSTPAVGGGRIRISDYTIQAVYSCDNSTISEIGVMAHELGHGFGLPDLYNTQNTSLAGGVGNWDLMGTGAWGCISGGPARPCHMGAWSKAVLGWVDVVTLEPGSDHGVVTLPPVATSGRVLQVPAGDGSGEFFLLENRQRIGFDEGLLSPGLLVWHVDPSVIGQKSVPGTRWATNSVNNDRNRPGVWLRQADGRDDLAQSPNRGDAGDPFPGNTFNPSFHAGSNPASFSHRGTATGVTLLEIQQVAPLGDMQFRLLNRLQAVTLGAEGATGGTTFLLDGSPVGAPHTFASAPFQAHAVEAVAGALLEPGVRAGFEGWLDGAPRARTLTTGLRDTTHLARFGRRELEVVVTQSGGPLGVIPGTVDIEGATPDGWVPEGATATFQATPRTGFSFASWAGGLAGLPNPTTVTVGAPLQVEARYDMTYAVEAPSAVELEAARPVELEFQVANATHPVAWYVVSAELPLGLEFFGGWLRGAPLDAGTFPLTVRAVDATGLSANADVEIRVTPPLIEVEALVGPFLLTAAAPSATQLQYLDRAGNRNGVYDLGDLRAFVLANPGLPMSARDRGVLRGVVPLPPARRGDR
jgi:M6 family metalloprotease-like protein